MNNELLLRCYVKRERLCWVAICIDLCLAAQAESQEEAQKKLESMISTYVADALGKHKEYASQLLSRKAPISQIAFYYRALLLNKVMSVLGKESKKSSGLAFSEHYPIGVAG